MKKLMRRQRTRFAQWDVPRTARKDASAINSQLSRFVMFVMFVVICPLSSSKKTRLPFQEDGSLNILALSVLGLRALVSRPSFDATSSRKPWRPFRVLHSRDLPRHILGDLALELRRSGHQNRYRLALVPSVDEKISIHRDDGQIGEAFTEADQAEVGEIRTTIGITRGQHTDPLPA